MWKDEIVDETRRVREAYVAQLNYDFETIYKDLKAKELQGGHKIVSLTPKPPMLLLIPQAKSVTA